MIQLSSEQAFGKQSQWSTCTHHTLGIANTRAEQTLLAITQQVTASTQSTDNLRDTNACA